MIRMRMEHSNHLQAAPLGLGLAFRQVASAEVISPAPGFALAPVLQRQEGHHLAPRAVVAPQEQTRSFVRVAVLAMLLQHALDKRGADN